MPTSHWNQLNEIMNLVMSIRPKVVLDIGVGFGKFGVLLREYLELWDGRDQYSNFQRRIDGIEIFHAYKNPLYDWVYNNIYIGDALELIPTLNCNYDMALMIDVLEHFEKSEGINLLSNLIDKCKFILIATPHIPSSQKVAFNNIYETHKSKWSIEEFKKFNIQALVPNEKSIICLMRGGHV